ncbi:molybdate ABC transporter substrate-binding protein [Microcella daejeonensis]|uniref:molybdate ABC transporter substrate-binding protein n=1 Tax=Microcella daejeonensis TaxID=2994971 RepID=UPI002270527B|nr:molybdate ABC transporter substrate-binding protein [Microcella daejeonensis]WAB83153.1 molybdate ABC transporter substrate-binding protein [Microcella daejeonensis]
MIALASAGLILAGCSSAVAEQTPHDGAPAGAITVFAAASLGGSFATIVEAFRQENPGVTVTVSVGGSAGLATQIVEGAPADVFAAANPATMAAVRDAGLTRGAPVAFATNWLQIAVAPGNPGAVSALDDLADPDRTIALCAVEVPCGAAAAELFAAAGITPSPDTYEQDVRAVLTKVELGEVDAGLVYVTDVREAGDAVEGIEVDSDPVGYPIAALSASSNPRAAEAFVDFVLSAAGRRILGEAGFGAP